MDQTKTFIKRCEEMWEEQGFGLFAVGLLETGELAGVVGLIMRKLGMNLDRETVDPSCGRSVKLYAAKREKFLTEASRSE